MGLSSSAAPLARLAGRIAWPFYCLTEDLAAWVTAHRIVPRRKIRLIFNGIDTALFREPCDPDAIRQELGISPGSPVIGTVGRLSEIRQDVLIRAFARIREQLPTSHLILVGDGPLRQSLRELAAGLGLDAYVHFVGFRPHSAPYLRAMDVFALTSRSEGMPQAVLEAQVVGVPVCREPGRRAPGTIDHGPGPVSSSSPGTSWNSPRLCCGSCPIQSVRGG